MIARVALALFAAFVVVDVAGCLYVTRDFACDGDAACLDGQRCVEGTCRDDTTIAAATVVAAAPSTTAAGEGEGEGFAAGEGEGEGEGEGSNEGGGAGEGEGEGAVGEGEGEGAAGGACDVLWADTFDDASVAPPFAVVDDAPAAAASFSGGQLVATFDGVDGPATAFVRGDEDMRGVSIVAQIARAPSATNVALVFARVENPADASDFVEVRLLDGKIEIEVKNNGAQVSFARIPFDAGAQQFVRVRFDVDDDAIGVDASSDGATFSSVVSAAASSDGVAPAYFAEAHVSFGGANRSFSADSVAFDAVTLWRAGCP